MFLYLPFAHYEILSAATAVLFRKVNISYFNFIDNNKSGNVKLKLTTREKLTCKCTLFITDWSPWSSIPWTVLQKTLNNQIVSNLGEWVLIAVLAWCVTRSTSSGFTWRIYNQGAKHLICSRSREQKVNTSIFLNINQARAAKCHCALTIHHTSRCFFSLFTKTIKKIVTPFIILKFGININRCLS